MIYGVNCTWLQNAFIFRALKKYNEFKMCLLNKTIVPNFFYIINIIIESGWNKNHDIFSSTTFLCRQDDSNFFTKIEFFLL